MKGNSKKWTRIVSLFSVLIVCLLGATAAFGQAETGQVTVKVVDPQGALIANATVALKSETGYSQTKTANEEGVAIFTNLKPGFYSVSSTASGFGELTKRAEVTVGAKLEIVMTMTTGAVKESVTVVAGEAGVQVNTQTQELSTVVSQKQITELPTLTRNAYDLVGLSGNVSEGTGFMRGTGFSINGQRAASTSVLLDGAENVDNFTASVGQQVPLDAVQEFRVITSNFSAEYGRASGGIVNVATNSGSNSYHGSAYEFNRISALASNGFRNNAFEIPKQVFTRNQFGYSVGGRVIKDKLFFFSDTEWIRVRSGGALVAWVPTPQLIAASNSATQAFFAPYKLNGSIGTILTVSQVIGAKGGSAAFKKTPNASTNAFLALNPSLPAFEQVYLLRSSCWMCTCRKRMASN